MQYKEGHIRRMDNYASAVYSQNYKMPLHVVYMYT